MAAYALVLLIHSYLRWAVLLAVVALFVRTLLGWQKARAWQPADERLHSASVGLVDLQFLLGLVLYLLLSPISKAFFADMKYGMKDSSLRFFGLEHVFGMLV